MAKRELARAEQEAYAKLAAAARELREAQAAADEEAAAQVAAEEARRQNPAQTDADLRLASVAGEIPRLALSMREAAKAISVSERTMWSLVKSGEIKSVKAGARRIIPVEALKLWLAQETGKRKA